MRFRSGPVLVLFVLASCATPEVRPSPAPAPTLAEPDLAGYLNNFDAKRIRALMDTAKPRMESIP